MGFRLKRYQREFDHSYSFGVFATLELLGCRPDCVDRVLLASKGERSVGVARLRDECAAKGIPVGVDDTAIERLSPRESHLAVGVFRKYQAALDAARDHLVLVNPADMGNLGTIARTMAAFGLADLAVIRPAVDLFDPRAVRASMGALFRLSFQYFEDFGTYRAAFGHNLYPLMTDGAVALGEVSFTPPWALVFGSESSGLPADFHGLGTSVRIPQTDRVDSLNLSVAVGIVLYAACTAGR
jgi:TrmH family RNA methyltransferase